MDKYMGLKYETYHNIPMNKDYSKVYFCSYDLDFENSFKTISEEIWNIKKTVIFWHKDFSVDYYKNDSIREDFLSDLQQMQLFIIPVTYEFLYTNNVARLIELPFAIRHNIPVLPILQDTSLALEFNKKCGDLQALDRSTVDLTVIPYELKLKKFLERVLISDELIGKIKESFVGYIFLSYRKKDRKLAQDTMKVIHSNELCRDIAIWYDEYLIPGENFNDTILEALLKSQLFVLIVTPQILEKPNYVMTVEYPMAWKYNKKILPIIVQKTDEESLQKYYEKIPMAIEISEKNDINNILTELFNGKKIDKNEDSDHLYYMGLAYLSGIDVEIDSGRAISLLETAAEKMNLSAYEKLVEVYRYGIGVKKNLQKAIEWQKKLSDIELVLYKIKRTNNICKMYIDSLLCLTELYEEQKDYGMIRGVIQTICNFIKHEASQFDDLDLYLLEEDAYSKLCEISIEENNIDEFIYYFPKYQQVLSKCTDNVTGFDRKRLQREVILKEYELKLLKEEYENDSIDVKLAEVKLENAKIVKEKFDKLYYEVVCRHFIYIAKCIKVALITGNKEEAQNNAEKAVREINKLDMEKDSRVIAMILAQVSEVFINTADYRKAEEIVKKSITVCNNTTKQYDAEIVKILIDNYSQLTVIYYHENNFQTLYTILTERLTICLKFVEKTGSADAILKCIEAYEDFGEIEKNAGNFEKSKGYFLAAYELAEKLYNEYKESWAIKQLSLITSLLEDIANLQKDEEKEKYYREMTMKLDVEQAYMELLLRNRSGRNQLFNKILNWGEKLEILADEPFLVDWLVESYNQFGYEEESSNVNNLFLVLISELIKIAEHTDKTGITLILMRLHRELADILSRMEKRWEGRQEAWIALQIGRKLLQEDFTEEQVEEVLEICKNLYDEYLESNLEEEWSKRLSVIFYELELANVNGDTICIGEIVENEFFHAAVNEVEEKCENAEKQYRFLTVLISSLNEERIHLYRDINKYYGFLLDLLILNKCYHKDISVMDIFGESFEKYFKINSDININKLNFDIYLGIARMKYMNGRYKDGYQMYLFLKENIAEHNDEMLKSLKLSINILLERTEYEEALKICEIALQVAIREYETIGDYMSSCDCGFFCGINGYICVKMGDEDSALKYYQSAVEFNEYGIKDAVYNDSKVYLHEVGEFILIKLDELLNIYRKYNEILEKKGRVIEKSSNEKRMKEIEQLIRNHSDI